ncbi:hypothetical protein IPF37_03475 [bacterium]|nr:MAG: hypothetical protein IPF37_03475 [bacterium]
MKNYFSKIFCIALLITIIIPKNIFCILDFANRDTNLIINPTAGTSRIMLGSLTGITGWTQDSIIVSYGNNAPSAWTETYTAGVQIGTGRRKAPSNMIYNNSNAIVSLQRFVRTDSNAMTYLVRINSNAINGLYPLVKQNSNTIRRYSTLVKQNSNAMNSLSLSTLATLLRTTSNLISVITPLVKQNSNAINALNLTTLTTLVRNSSNLINVLTPLVKQNSSTINHYSILVKQNSNALVSLKDLGRNTSNALVSLQTFVRTDSNALTNLLVLVRTTSNTINSSDSTLAPLLRQTSNLINVITPLVKQNSNAIVNLKNFVRTTSNALVNLETFVRTDSNALTNLATLVRTSSNAFIYNTRTTSNALLSLQTFVRTDSNAITNLLVLVRTTSNTINSSDSTLAPLLRQTSNLINVLTPLVKQNSNAINRACPLIKQNSNAIVALERLAHIFLNNSNFVATTTICALNYYKAGFTVAAGKTLILNDPLPISGKINLNNTGILSFGSDVYFGANVYFTNGGLLQGNGHSLILTGSLTIPANKTVRIDSNTIIDGQGNDIFLDNNAKFAVSAGVTFTLRNVKLKNLSGIQIDLEGAGTAALALADSAIFLDHNFHFADGKLFVHEDVHICGTNKFIYESLYPLYITSNSALICNPASTFRYIPGGGTSSTDRTLMRFADTTSFFYLDQATFEAPVNGVQILRGTMAFDNKCTIINLLADGVTPNITRTNAVTIGDGTTSDNDATLHVFSGAHLEVQGYLDYNNAN